jgi:hypothetical protein
MPLFDYDREQFPMNRNVTESAVDRLIAMAEDEKHDSSKPADEIHDHPHPGDQPPAPPGSMAMLPDPLRGLEDNPMLKTLLQFRMLMPYLSPTMPQEQDPAMAGLSTELKQSVGDLQLAQRDLRMTVQEQLVQMKRVEEEMHRTREATEKNAFESANLVEDMKSVYSLLRKTAGILGVMIAALIALAVWLIAHNPHLLH